MPTGLTPKQVAQQLDVHANTVRLWCGEFADVLSDSARGRPRLFTPPDVAILQRVKDMRAEGLSRSEVLERLRQTPTADLQTPYIDAKSPTPATPTETPTEAHIAPLVAVDVTSVLSELLESTRSAATQEDVKRIDERLHKLEAQRLIYIGAVAGLVAGVALGVIVALLLLRP